MFVFIPKRLFDDPHSSLHYSREGELLGARIAPDGQWRFPVMDSLPEKYVKCLTAYEDKRFFYHFGVDPLALGRAARLNSGAGRVVSGGSTITMQLARMARGNRERKFYEKGVEAIWAVFIESTHRKRTILRLYASHAPFGGNVVGLEAASWRYFGAPPHLLSWAETATLTVLPNSPALIHPGRNRNALLQKRNALLDRLRQKGVIDDTDYELACLEPLPEAPVPLPDIAPHMTERLSAAAPGSRTISAIEVSLQKRVSHIAARYSREYASNHIHNLAALVADVETGEILAYVGNTPQSAGNERGEKVDVAIAPRSTGSILKPILYAAMLHDGEILPNTLVADTPLNINGFTPHNYNHTFYGTVPARVAIERSLNVPLVRMLSVYKTGRLMTLLKRLGMTTLRFDEDHYGAALILGGAEGKLEDISGIYASMARTLSHYHEQSGRYNASDIHPLTPYLSEGRKHKETEDPLLSAASIWFSFEAMSGLNRPEEEAEWRQFASMKRVAWKTGTSYGGRDAWAVGVTPRYVVGVWVGNASGEGRPGLTGVGNAAPVLFDIFSLLPGGGWFEAPHDELEPMPICRLSGHKATAACEPVDTLMMPLSGIDTPLCPYHRTIHLSADGQWQVNSSCESTDRMTTRNWFVLPPAQEYYYRHFNAAYEPLPPYKPQCREAMGRSIDLIYPEHGAILMLPRGFDGEQKFIFRAAHVRPEALIYWHLDDTYLDRTDGEHQISCSPSPGHHILTLSDDKGNRKIISFEVK